MLMGPGRGTGAFENSGYRNAKEEGKVLNEQSQPVAGLLRSRNQNEPRDKQKRRNSYVSRGETNVEGQI